MSIQTDKLIKVDEKTIIDAPTIEILEYRVRPLESSIGITCKFTSGKTEVVREIGFLKYSEKWTILDIENYVLEFLSSKEVIDNIIKGKT